MGFFSWLDCEDNSQIKIGELKTHYVLVPSEFGYERIDNFCYDGYGNFGAIDIFELIAMWNRKYLANFKYSAEGRSYHGDEYCDKMEETIHRFCEAEPQDYEDETHEYDPCEGEYDDDPLNWEFFYWAFGDVLSDIGHDIYSERKNGYNLKYTIKITHNPKAIYENSKESEDDPAQGL